MFSLLDQALLTCLETLEAEQLQLAIDRVLCSLDTPDERARLLERIEELRRHVERGRDDSYP